MARDDSPAPKHSSKADASSLRKQIDRLDQELIELLNRRAQAEVELAKTRGNAESPAAPAPGASEPWPERLAKLNGGPLPAGVLQAVYRELASGWRALEAPAKVAFLGPAYTYSHVAAMHRFGQTVEQIPVGSIAAVFEEVVRGHADFGVVPVENSTDGRIADTLDMFTRMRVRICGEVPLRIHHSLLGLGSRGDIVEVQSKPQALSQCRNWLAKHVPGARLVEVASTIVAAQAAREKPGIAAIAGVQAAAMYELNVLSENIEDNPSNVTRFFIIGDESAPRTGKDKMSAMFEVPHQPGALADAMNIFKRAKLNLTWIESFPIARPEGGYLFFIELDGHETDARVRRAIRALEKKTIRLETLGSYPRAEPVG